MDIDSPSNICTVYDTFDFSKFILTHPESLPGGSFFTKLNINNDVLYLQTPKCISKQGVVSSSGKKSYIDLMFSSDDSKFIEFMENLEKSCVEKIHEKRNCLFRPPAYRQNLGFGLPLLLGSDRFIGSVCGIRARRVDSRIYRRIRFNSQCPSRLWLAVDCLQSL